MRQPLTNLGNRFISIRLATQIASLQVICLCGFALWRLMLDAEPSRQIRAFVLTACMVIVCLPVIIRGASMLFTRRWFIGLVCLILGPMLCIGLFMLGAQAIHKMIPKQHASQVTAQSKPLADHLTIPTNLVLTEIDGRKSKSMEFSHYFS